jgi:hypothetical protein
MARMIVRSNLPPVSLCLSHSVSLSLSLSLSVSLSVSLSLSLSHTHTLCISLCLSLCLTFSPCLFTLVSILQQRLVEVNQIIELLQTKSSKRPSIEYSLDTITDAYYQVPTLPPSQRTV